MNSIIVSSTGYARMKERLHTVTRRYDVVREERQLAFELAGDGWHDNPSLNALQQQEAELTRQVAQLARQCADARVLDVRDGDRPVEAVRYGSIVMLESQEPQSHQVWEIVGYEESDMSTRKLAYSSPLGSRLIGKEEGEEVELPNGGVAFVAALYPSWRECPSLPS